MPAEKYLRRCFQLALNAIGSVAPNPMVGAVIVYEDSILGEGFHEKFGEAHAEVNAINNAIESGFENLLSKSTIYVNLEPCTHFGKTPPCTDLIIKHNFKKVVISTIDPFDQVSGKGVAKLKSAGIEVSTGILEEEGNEVNKRFFTFQKKKRPFIILKYAQSADGFISPFNSTSESRKISNELSTKLVHQWRSEESAILIGTTTALIDNPELTVRKHSGKNPIRMVIDKNLKLPLTNLAFNNAAKTIIFNDSKNESIDNLQYVKFDFSKSLPEQINQFSYENNIQSILIEGGTKIHQQFIDQDLWDEFRTITSNKILNEGVKASSFNGLLVSEFNLASDQIKIYKSNL